MAGLLAARALSEHYTRVTLIERDEFPATAEQRKGVTQGKHTHGLLSRGLEILEKFFPGFTSELEAEGAVSRTWSETAGGTSAGGISPRQPRQAVW